MKKLYFFAFLIILLVMSGCTPEEGVNLRKAQPQLITRLPVEPSTSHEATMAFQEWLFLETYYDASTNKIEAIIEYKHYYDIEITTAFPIVQREEQEVRGYKYYKLNKDGMLMGYYISK